MCMSLDQTACRTKELNPNALQEDSIIIIPLDK